MWLRRTMCEVAWAAAHTKDTYFAAQFRRIAARRGKKRALIAVAHSVLVAAYYMLKYKRHYHELGGDFFDSPQQRSSQTPLSAATRKTWLRRHSDRGPRKLAPGGSSLHTKYRQQASAPRSPGAEPR